MVLPESSNAARYHAEMQMTLYCSTRRFILLSNDFMEVFHGVPYILLIGFHPVVNHTPGMNCSKNHRSILSCNVSDDRAFVFTGPRQRPYRTQSESGAVIGSWDPESRVDARGSCIQSARGAGVSDSHRRGRVQSTRAQASVSMLMHDINAMLENPLMANNIYA